MTEPQPQSLLISNHPLRCPHCALWTVRRARRHTPFVAATDVYLCAGCGRVQAFEDGPR